MQFASGLRNGWSLSETVQIATSAEYLRVYRGQAQDAYALTGAIEWRPNDLWLISNRLEWRRLINHQGEGATAPALEGNDTWLSMVSIARKINRDWTFLGRNYLLYGSDGASYYQGDPYSSNNEGFDKHIVSAHSEYHPSRPWWFSARAAAKSQRDYFDGRSDTYRAYLLGGRVTYDILNVGM